MKFKQPTIKCCENMEVFNYLVEHPEMFTEPYPPDWNRQPVLSDKATEIQKKIYKWHLDDDYFYKLSKKEQEEIIKELDETFERSKEKFINNRESTQ